MSMVHQKFVVIVLAVLIALGSVSNAVAGALSCLPKACCCTVKTQNMKDHHAKMDVEKTQKCMPEDPAPCCRVEPFQQKTDIAISSSPTVVPQRMSALYTLVANTLNMPQVDRTNVIKSILDTGPLLKIPTVPIYLQTQSILC